MTTFYTNNLRTTLTRLCLVFISCFSYTLIQAQCNPDVTPPVAVCDAFINVALSADGTAQLFAETFDDGSFDNCCDVSLEVRRDGSTCPDYTDDANFGASVTFCCEDVNASNNTFVILQVSDCNGNTNTCLVEVVVEDKLSPVVTCPVDVIINCGTFFDDIHNAYLTSTSALNTALSLTTGDATIFDNCEAFASIQNVFSSSTFCEDFTITRTWTASDNNPGNSTANCTQIITVDYDNSAWNVNFPNEITVNDFGMATPDFTGTPIVTTGSCGIFAQTYEDIVLAGTDNCAKILRTWTVIDWCSTEVMENVQIIHIEGGLAPTVECPADFVVYTNSDGYATVTVPLPTTTGNIDNYIVTATTDLPNFNPNNYTADNVLLGNYSATFTVTDFCENDATCTVNIQIEELGNTNCPADTTINCDSYQNNLENLLSQLAGDSQAQNESLDQFFGAPSFQGGMNISSSVAIDIDACGQGTLTRTWELDDTPSGDCFTPIAASASGNNGDQVCIDVTVNGFDDILSFQYTMDFDPTMLAYNSVVDPENISDLNFGLNNTSDGHVSILWFDEDNTDGETYPDGTLMYQVCFDIVGSGGQMTAVTFSSNPTLIEITNGDEEDVCFNSISSSVVINLNSPESIVVNPPPTVLCTQIITLEYTGDWSVIFPSDTTASCTFGTLEAGEPQIIDGGCSLLAVAYEDVVFNNTPGGGSLIERTWTVINWCDNSVETHTQTISVTDDNAAPSFANNCTLPDVCLEGNTFSCIGGLTIPTPEVMDCSNDVNLTASSDFGEGFGPYVNVSPGSYLVTYTATDPFGNTATCVSNINVVDCSAPVAICKEAVIISLTDNPNGDPMAAIYPTDLNDGSYDNCSTNLDFSFAANVDLSELTLDCTNVGNNNITLFVTDENGNQNSCITNIILEDLMNLCPADPCAGNNTTALACNDNIQVSLDLNGNSAITFDIVLEGFSAACIDVLDLSFSPTTDVDVLNYNCSNLGNNFATVYLTLDNGQQNTCWTNINVQDLVGACGDPTDCTNDVIPPTPDCKDGIVVELMQVNDPNNPTPQPYIEVWASDLDEGSFDNCPGNLTFSFSSDVTDLTTSYSCDELGQHPIQLWVTDAAGNQNFCQSFIVVQFSPNSCGDTDCVDNTIPPIAICNDGVIVSLGLSGETQIFASDIDEGSYDDCSLEVELSFSPDITDDVATFNCEDVGDNAVIMYVTDENGNQNQCWTTVIVQDNINACDNECLNDVIAPEAFCISALVIQMPSTGALTLSASLFDVGSSDNCTDDLSLQISTIDGNGEIISGPATGLPFNINNVGANNIVLTVTDAAGNSSECNTILLLQSNPPQVIRGKIFMDENDDCTYNAGEMGLDSWQVKLEAIDDTLATDPGIVVLPPDFTIDADGNYTVTLPEDFVFFTPDSSVVNVNNLNPYLRVSLATGFNYGQNCDYNYFINSTTNVFDTIDIDFPVQILEDCPQLSVDVTAPYLRRCFDNTYSINYCNFGNIDAADAYIEVDFDEFLEINSSTLPWTSVDGTTYRFDLGTVTAAECGSFEVNATVSCDAVLGQTHCVQANIYPAVLCDPQSPEWSGASIDITGECDGDMVRFTITNVGDEDMDETADFVVIEDFIMYNTGTFNLVAGASTVIEMAANGSTWRVEADQASNHPGNSKPSLAIEGCTIDGNFSLGMVTQFVQNDNDPFVSINCMENVGSFDPNDKIATVIGYGDEHYINQNTDIEYLIRFQNTGTDTAFNIVVIDTLDVNLDPLSVRPGTSSHPYDFTILGDNVLKFNFDNIALPDSNINEVASHGYIKFRVSQYPDVALETVIENNAAIYFDFNEPIITNVVFHTIGDHFLDMVDATEAPTSTAKINVFPNPFDEEATVEITGLDIQNGLFKVYDMQGRLLQTFDFAGTKFSVKREELPSGMYFYQLESKADGLMTSGKLIIK